MIREEGLCRVLQRLNQVRHAPANDAERDELRATEELIEEIFRPSERLAVYGSLAPGKENYYVVRHLEGTWEGAEVEGGLFDSGWGASHGFPAMRWMPGFPAIPVQLLHSAGLRTYWPALDDFEGEDYRRSLVPVRRSGRTIAVANLYESRAVPPGTAW